jgi:threonine synthase
MQRKQLTTAENSNVVAVEVDGSFDDCQALVKQAFNDISLRQQICLSSANSINIARLIPQIFYYFFAFHQMGLLQDNVIFSVPSGNFGNLTAGLIAKKLGLPIKQFVAATNSNNIVPRFLETGIFQPEPSKHTLSNAMDVGNPSNFFRIMALYNNDIDELRKNLTGFSFSDEATKQAIQDVYQRTGYILEPHSAIAYLGQEMYQKKNPSFSGQKIALATAHPAKYVSLLQDLLGVEIPLPASLEQILRKEEHFISMPNSYAALKRLLEGY